MARRQRLKPLTPDEVHAVYCDWKVQNNPSQEERYERRAKQILEDYYGLGHSQKR